MTTIEVALRRRQRDGEALARAMDDCLSDANMLRRLVETLLEQFRMEADPSVARNVEVDVTAVLDLCADAVETLARQKDVTVVRAYPAGLRFLTQPQRLRSVASNLLGNGIEYNRPGGTVELGCEVGGPGLVLSVRNTGQGIAEGDLSHVFEPFYRATSSEHAGEGHAGLGLFLVKSHVEALGGRCELDNRPGQGCTFRVHLPHPTGATETRAADEGRSGADPRRQHFPTPAESHGALMNID
jgi:signal transduction histidine kinase